MDPSVAGESRDNDTQNKTWTVTFTNGTVVSGIASCNDISGTYAQPYSGNQNNIQPGTEGINCWCRMLYPVRSAWVYDMETNGCSSNCAYTCGHHVNTLSDFRRGVYTSAGN